LSEGHVDTRFAKTERERERGRDSNSFGLILEEVHARNRRVATKCGGIVHCSLDYRIFAAVYDEQRRGRPFMYVSCVKWGRPAEIMQPTIVVRSNVMAPDNIRGHIRFYATAIGDCEIALNSPSDRRLCSTNLLHLRTASRSSPPLPLLAARFGFSQRQGSCPAPATRQKKFIANKTPTRTVCR
jgi:hypothetical protein